MKTHLLLIFSFSNLGFKTARMLVNWAYCHSHCLFLVVLLSYLQISVTVHGRKDSLPVGGTPFAGTRVWGAMIQTDPEMAALLGRDFYRVPQGVNGTAADNARLRNKHGAEMVKQLPFHVDMWPSVFSSSCPNRATKGGYGTQLLCR
jgi:hypothetical protein